MHVACIERDPAACATLGAAGLPVLRADSRKLDWKAFAGVDLAWASPPCQPGSTARNGTADERDGWPAAIAALDAVRPTWFLAENVLEWTFHAASCRMGGRCVLCAWERQILPAITDRLAFNGTWRLDAADFGLDLSRGTPVSCERWVRTVSPETSPGSWRRVCSGGTLRRSAAQLIGRANVAAAECRWRAEDA